MIRNRPAHVSGRISSRQRRALYFFASLLWLSGLGWLIAHYALRSSDLLAVAHPSEPWWLRAHGAAVIGFLITFGALLPGHIWRGWRQGLNRGSGLAMIAVAAILTLSGYGLYYLVGDEWRGWTSFIHWLVGLASAVALLVHVLLGKRRVARARLTQTSRSLRYRLAARGPGPETPSAPAPPSAGRRTARSW
jgi:hypothetical protein